MSTVSLPCSAANHCASRCSLHCGAAEVAGIIPGSSATLQDTFTDPGKYQIACHLPGHSEAGMVLEIDITAWTVDTSLPPGFGSGFGQPHIDSF